MTEASRALALGSIAARLRKTYLYPALVPKILAKLNASAARYATDDPVLFARMITDDMQAVSGDTHLYLNFEPGWYAASRAAPTPGKVAADAALAISEARDFNHGLAETRILPGNVRYLRLDGFFWVGPESARAYDSAMRFLRDGKAIILDLRGNGGGDTAAAYYLLSYLLAPGAPIVREVSPGARDRQVRASLRLPGRRLSDLPLFVLVNGHSRSAAEAVAYTVREFRLGAVVGERTAGAAHISDDTAIAPFFRFSVPIRRTVNPVSGTDWEGVGVAPTVSTSSRGALDTAYGLALTALLRSTRDAEKRAFLVWAQQGVLARLAGRPPDGAELPALAGKYGPAEVEFRDDALWLHRPDRTDLKLVPIGPDGLFEAEEVDTLRVRIGKRSLDVLRPLAVLDEHYER